MCCSTRRNNGDSRGGLGRSGRYTRAQISTPPQLPAGESGANQEHAPRVRRGEESATRTRQRRSARAERKPLQTPNAKKRADGGQTWADVSGNLPDVPVTDVVISHGTLVVGADLGVVVSGDGGAHWSPLGTGLPYTVMDLSLGPDGRLYAATHGRGIWSIAAP